MAIITEDLRDGMHDSQAAFLDYLREWERALSPAQLGRLVQQAGGPEHVAIMSVDLVNGFTRIGPLHSPRIAALVPRVRRLLEHAHTLGLRHFVFLHDNHPADSPEFSAFPRHCVEGTEEALMDPDLASLPFARDFTVFGKASISSTIGTDLPSWLARHPELTCVLVVGDCTDLCVYQLAMYLHLRSNVERRGYRVVVPATCVDTYDLPVDLARRLGVLAHDGEVMQRIALHQMALNGIQVVQSVH